MPHSNASKTPRHALTERVLSTAPRSKPWCTRSSAMASSALSISSWISARIEDPEGGSRAVITLDGKFLPYKPF